MDKTLTDDPRGITIPMQAYREQQERRLREMQDEARERRVAACATARAAAPEAYGEAAAAAAAEAAGEHDDDDDDAALDIPRQADVQPQGSPRRVVPAGPPDAAWTAGDRLRRGRKDRRGDAMTTSSWSATGRARR